MDVGLRPVEDSDLDSIFEQMRDPEAVRMAAFTPEDPNDRAAFDARMARLRSSSDIVMLAVVGDGRFFGSIASFVIDGHTEVSYWIDRSVWGKGIASRALAMFLGEIAVRPLWARVASDNAGSLRVLQKAGFQVVRKETSFASARGTAIEETILRTD